MTTPVIQPSFAAGEISPSLWARIDLSKFHVGAALLENFVVDYRGGVFNRAGTMIVGQTKSPNNIQLIPFTFNTEQTYVLEFGALYIRFIVDGAYILTTAQNITNITRASPAVVTYAGVALTSGDTVFISDVQGMSQINGQYARVGTTNTATNSMTILTQGGTNIDTTGYSPYSTGGTVTPVYTLTTGIPERSIGTLKYTQSADTMTITSVDFNPLDLVRRGNTSWTIGSISFASSLPAITITGFASNSSGSTTYNYQIRAVNSAGEEGPSGNLFPATGCAAFSNTPNQFVIINFNTSTAAAYYRIYRTREVIGSDPGSNSIYGFLSVIPSTAGGSFYDTPANIPDFTDTPPVATNPFTTLGPPRCSTYFQQRQVYGGMSSASNSLALSQPGARKNMDVRTPSQDDDAITATISAQQINSIEFMLATSLGLITFTTGGAFLVTGGGGGGVGAQTPVTPTNITAAPQLSNGINPDMRPLVINSEILYVQNMGSVIRNFNYNIGTTNYLGNDLTVLANHLFDGYTLVDWDWAQEPDKVVWVCRDDGTALSLTYLRDQEVSAWARHVTTNGFFRNVVQVQEGNESAVYFLIERFISGHWVKYIERMASRDFGANIADGWFLDSAVKTAGTQPAFILTPSATAGASITLSASGAAFSASNVGSWVQVNNGIVSLDTFTSASQVSGVCKLVLASTYPATAGAWSVFSTASTFYGLSTLEGQTVYANADGVIQGPFVVANATCTISASAHIVTIGLPYTATMQTLYLDTGDPTIQSKRKKISAASARVVDTRGITIGQDLSRMYPWKGANGRTDEPTVQGNLPTLTTGDMRINLDPAMNIYGQIYIRQAQPWPVTVTGVIPEPVVGDDTK